MIVLHFSFYLQINVKKASYYISYNILMKLILFVAHSGPPGFVQVGS